MADYIIQYLGEGEAILVDTLGENLDDPNAFNRTIEKLRGNGLNDKYTFFRHPDSQSSENFRKLYIRRAA